MLSLFIYLRFLPFPSHFIHPCITRTFITILFSFYNSIQKILALVEDGNGNVQKLKGLNKENQNAVNQLIDAAQTSMNQLAAAAQEGSTIANSPPDIPPEQFNGRKGTACTAQATTASAGGSSPPPSFLAPAASSATKLRSRSRRFRPRQ